MLVHIIFHLFNYIQEMLHVLDLPVQHMQNCHCPLDGDVLRIAAVATPPDDGDVLRIATELPPTGEILRIATPDCVVACCC